MANKSALVANNIESKIMAFPEAMTLEEPEIKSSTGFVPWKDK